MRRTLLDLRQIAPTDGEDRTPDGNARRGARNGSSGIAQAHGLSLSWTGRLLRQQGAVLPPIRQGVRRADLPVAEIIRKYEKGASMQALADENNPSYGTIHRLLIKNKVRIRPHGGQNAIEFSPLLAPRPRQ